MAFNDLYELYSKGIQEMRKNPTNKNLAKVVARRVTALIKSYSSIRDGSTTLSSPAAIAAQLADVNAEMTRAIDSDPPEPNVYDLGRHIKTSATLMDVNNRIDTIRASISQEPSPSQVEQMDSSLLEGLLSLRAEPNFDDIVSTRSDSNQTLAHMSVLYSNMSLLKQLVEWRIDLSVADISGLTALHYAYQKEDRESIRILLRGGASTAIADKLGRFPRDLAPEGSDLADWVNRV